MRVLRITHSLNYGGIERVCELHAKYVGNDHELILVAINKGGATADKIAQLGIPVHTLHTKGRIPDVATFKSLLRLFRELKPDVIHTCGAEANFHGLLAGWWAGVPRRVGEEIGIPNHSFMAKLVFRLVYLAAHKVVAISLAVGDYLGSFEVASGRVAVVYNPVESGAWDEPLRDHTNLRLACVCRLAPIKNLPLLIDLLGVLRERIPGMNPELWLIGEGTERAKLEQYAKQKGLLAFVTFTGYSDEPRKLLMRTDIFVLPSWFEGFGLACVEAIQCGIPVIVTNSGGMPEYIRDGVNGFLFDPHSMKQLVEKTMKFLSMSEEERKAMTQRARQTVDEMFSPDRYIKALNSVYGR